MSVFKARASFCFIYSHISVIKRSTATSRAAERIRGAWGKSISGVPMTIIIFKTTRLKNRRTALQALRILLKREPWCLTLAPILMGPCLGNFRLILKFWGPSKLGAQGNLPLPLPLGGPGYKHTYVKTSYRQDTIGVKLFCILEESKIIFMGMWIWHSNSNMQQQRLTLEGSFLGGHTVFASG